MARREEDIAALPPEMEEVETAEEVATAEEPTETEAELAQGAAGMQHTVEEIPGLAGKRVGDTVTLAIREISEDGNTYTLVETGEAGAPPVTEEMTPEAGRAAVEEELLGPGGPAGV